MGCGFGAPVVGVGVGVCVCEQNKSVRKYVIVIFSQSNKPKEGEY